MKLKITSSLNLIWLVLLCSNPAVNAQNMDHRYLGGEGNGFDIGFYEVLTGIETTLDVPEQVQLFQNYPNPFNPNTTISFALNEPGKVELVVYDLLGRKIQELINDNYSSGIYKISFSANTLSTGVYVYQLKTGNTIITKKLTLIK